LKLIVSFRTILLSTFLLTASAATAQRAVAILVDVDGPLDPPLSAGVELSAGQTVALQPKTTASIVHYEKCEFVSFRGGALHLTETSFSVSGANNVQKESASCPSSRRPSLVRSNEASGMGGMRIRTIATPQPVPPRPRILVTGNVVNVVAAEVIDGDQVIARFPLRDGRAAWPSGQPALRPGSTYIIRFVRQNGEIAGVPVAVSDNLKSDRRVPAVFALD
jgi:hypothetical protein